MQPGAVFTQGNVHNLTLLQVTERGHKAMLAGKAVLVNSQDARTSARLAMTDFVNNHLVMVALHSRNTDSVFPGNVGVGISLVIG